MPCKYDDYANNREGSQPGDCGLPGPDYRVEADRFHEGLWMCPDNCPGYEENQEVTTNDPG